MSEAGRAGVRVPSVGDLVRRRATVTAIGRGVGVGLWLIAIWRVIDQFAREFAREFLTGRFVSGRDMAESLVVSAALLGFGLGVFLLAGPMARLIVRAGRPGCPACGYDVDARAERCPECGLAVEQMRPAVIGAGDRWDEGVRRHRVMVMAGWVRVLSGLVALLSGGEAIQAGLMMSQFGAFGGAVGDVIWLIAPVITLVSSLVVFRFAIGVAGFVVPRATGGGSDEVVS